jgi:hypothetical protein
MLSRRDFVGKLAAGAGGVAVAWTASRASAAAGLTQDTAGTPNKASRADISVGEPQGLPGAAQEEAEANPPAAVPPPWDLFHPLVIGSVVAHGWRVTELSGPSHGACVLTLQNERGRIQRVHVCRNDGNPEGLVYTKQFDLIVMNGGQGDLLTEEGLAQAVAAVSHVLAANEGAWRQDSVMTALLPQADRRRQYAAESEWALR